MKEEGFEEALSYIMDSARLGYCVTGSDVAGYGGQDIPPELYIRWAQFSTFCGLFLNGGHGNRALWERTPQELEIVRKFAWLHNELVPYMYTHVVDCSKGGDPLMRPAGEGYEYYFGDDFYVSPIHRPGDGKATDWKVSLPEGRWRYLFNDDIVLEGPRTVEMAWPLNEAAVYVRDGAIVPLNVTRPYTGYGDRDSEGYLTLLVYPAGNRDFTVHHPDGSGDTTVRVEAGEELRIGLEGVRKPHVLLVRSEQEPQAVTLDGQALQKDAGWRYDPQKKRIVIKTDSYGQGAYAIRFQ
jgi:alpha-D-xyloside xylohydrolase